MNEVIKQTGPPVAPKNIKIGASEIALLRKHPAAVTRHREVRFLVAYMFVPSLHTGKINYAKK